MQLPTVPTPDDLLPLTEAARLLPSSRRGKRLHASTLYRWVREGRLRAWRIGRYWFVSAREVRALPSAGR